MPTNITFPAWPHKSGMEVEDNVDEEDNVYNGVNDEETHVFRRLVFEGNVVRDHYGGIESEAENYPIPDGLEGTVVEKNVRWGFGSFLAILR